MNSNEVTKLVEQYRDQYNELSQKLNQLVAENDHLRALNNQVQTDTKSAMLPQQNRESEFINAQLIETEQNLIHERQQVLKAMNSAGQAKKENEQLRKLVQQIQTAFAQQKQQFAKEFEVVTKQNREQKMLLDRKATEMDDLKSTLELYKQEIDSKNTMLSQTKSDRNAANIKSKKIEMEQDQSKMEILTQKEQNTNLKKQVKILQNQSSRAEQKMMDLNAELARQNQIKEEMAMKLRQMENEMGNTVQREIDLGMKERQLEQLAEDYRLEINELKAKLTNMAYQAKHLKEQNQAILNEMGTKVRESVDIAKEEANFEINKCRSEIDEMIQKEARLGEENERAKREKRSAEEALENLIRFRAANDDRNSQITELHQKLGNERKVRDTLNEQIRKIQQKNDELRREIEQRDEWKVSEIHQMEEKVSEAVNEMSLMRSELNSAQKENSILSSNLIREQNNHEKHENTLKQKIADLEENLIQAGIKSRAGNLDSKQSKVIRELQEDLANARTQLSRWKTEAIQVAQEADKKLRLSRQEKQKFTIANDDLRLELQEQIEKTGDYARRLTENERDRAQLTARIATLQQKLKPFLASA